MACSGVPSLQRWRGPHLFPSCWAGCRPPAPTLRAPQLLLQGCGAMAGPPDLSPVSGCADHQPGAPCCLTVRLLFASTGLFWNSKPAPGSPDPHLPTAPHLPPSPRPSSLVVWTLSQRPEGSVVLCPSHPCLLPDPPGPHAAHLLGARSCLQRSQGPSWSSATRQMQRAVVAAAARGL